MGEPRGEPVDGTGVDHREQLAGQRRPASASGKPRERADRAGRRGFEVEEHRRSVPRREKSPSLVVRTT
jgi:hypothetical protein